MATTCSFCNSLPCFTLPSHPSSRPSPPTRFFSLQPRHTRRLLFPQFHSLNLRTIGPDRGVPRSRLVVSGKASPITENEFPEVVLKSDAPVLVEFVANWCGPCRLISPVVDWASQEYKDKLKVVKIDHDANPKLIEEYKVYGLPTLILFKSGKEVADSRREGAMTKVKLKEYLDTLLESVAAA